MHQTDSASAIISRWGHRFFVLPCPPSCPNPLSSSDDSCLVVIFLFHHSFYIYQSTFYCKKQLHTLLHLFICISRDLWILILFDGDHSLPNYFMPKAFKPDAVSFDTPPSFFGYFITFWHSNMFQGHLVLSPTEPRQQSFH